MHSIDNSIRMLQNRQQGHNFDKDWFQNRTLYNMEKGNCYKTIFKNEDKDKIIQGIFTDVAKGEEFAITVSSGLILQRWNLKTGERQWKYISKPSLEFEKLSITNNKILCFGKKNFGYLMSNGYIQIIDLEKMEVNGISIPETINVHFLGKKIFGIRNKDLTIWNSKDCSAKVIKFDETIAPLNKEFSKRFIIETDKLNKITIYDRNTHTRKIIDVGALDPYISSITSMYTEKPFLYCGFLVEKGKKERPAFCKIDLEKGKIVDSYCIPCNSEQPSIVDQLIVDNGMAYLSNGQGNLFALNLTSKKEEKFDDGYVSYFALKNGILMSGLRSQPSSETPIPAVVKLWDTKSLKLIKTLEFPTLQAIAFGGDENCSGKILAAVGANLVQHDFECTHPGEILTENSLSELQEFTPPQPQQECLIQ